jgi:HEAT repeat protein
MHVLYALHGLLALDSKHLIAGLNDRDERVREHAVKLSEAAIVGAKGNSVLAEKLLAMTGDLSSRVRYQLAFSLGDVRSPARPKALVGRRLLGNVSAR